MIENILREASRKYPEHVAIIDEQGSYTYNRLYILQTGLAQYLDTSLGICGGERIAIFLENSAGFVFSFFANAQVGAISIPLNIHLKEPELQYLVDRFGISAVITSDDLAVRWAGIGRKIGKERILLVETFEGYLRDHVSPANTEDAVVLNSSHAQDPGREILWLTTSGSSGRPKVVSRSENNLIENANNVAGALRVTAQDRFLSVVPFYHANGFSNCMFLPITRGATIVSMRQFSARKMIELIRQENATMVFGSPFVYSVLCEVVGDDCVLPSVRYCLSTGAPMPDGLKKMFAGKFHENVLQLYGSTETGTISIQLEDSKGDRLALGKPLKSVEVKIVSENGTEISSMEAGEILVKSPALTKGYVNEPELNRQVFREGFFCTGDNGMINQEGSICLSGRRRRVINAAGVKIDPVEVEQVLRSYVKVNEAFVYGIKNKRGMEVIKAVLVAQPDCKVSDVITYCRDRLADFKIPRIVEFRKEIPKNILGKVTHTQVEEE